jgi:pimeloyl-ACP methyl ester carboxylesterase
VVQALDGPPAISKRSRSFRSLPKTRRPVLGLGGSGYSRLKAALDAKAPGSKTFRIEGSGHFIAEEKPAALLGYLGDFLR